VTSPSTAPRSLSPTFRLVIAAVLALVLLGSGAALAWVLVTRSGDDDAQAGREEVMAQTEQFMLRMGTYGPDLLDDQGAMPEYRDRVKAVITPKFAASFDKEAGAAEQLVAQAGVARSADVFATAVSTLDADSAQALVAGAFKDSFTRGKKRVDQEPIPFRIEVSLVKVDGKWLVDDFDPVSAGDSGQQGEQP
jgi:hypothetical protein